MLFALCGLFAQAQTVAITSTAVELISPNAVTRTFYDLDDLFLAYKSGKVYIYDIENPSTTIFSGDTSEVTVAGALIWSAKATKLALWYQSCTHTNGYRYFMPRREISYLYRGATSAVRFLNDDNKRTLLETHIDSVSVSGVSGASAKLTWLRNQAFLEGNRNSRGLPEAPTIAAGAAAGTSPTITLTQKTGNDFLVTLVTGTSTTSTGVLFTITLPNTYSAAGIPFVSASDTNSAASIANVFATATTTTYVLNVRGTALTAGGTTYVFACHYSGQ